MIRELNPVECIAGMTICGVGYMVCFEQPVERDSETEIAINEFIESLVC
jgi:hypothetical protein